MSDIFIRSSSLVSIHSGISHILGSFVLGHHVPYCIAKDIESLLSKKTTYTLMGYDLMHKCLFYICRILCVRKVYRNLSGSRIKPSGNSLLSTRDLCSEDLLSSHSFLYIRHSLGYIYLYAKFL